MLKIMTYTSMHFSIAFSVTWLLTGDVMIGGLIALVEPAANSVAYFFHEKLWQRLSEAGISENFPENEDTSALTA